ncbi:Serine/threonine-protein kinase pkn1 [Pirellulimonas nuda]|uniref:Serine/threonine-protein kinase pkn1 n=1 Tax=Pirellulimonas nuda TaxID=2528009 RepID=A0A518DHI6_9BACT|nr:SUMF1/EgtB/PvdO family nonheme iron enzyme [Pirellulimonas nuda]QDU90938.1 Serine/threonine-protein kinase pkn1 [Pirellulimonas nuda]
MSRRWHLLVAPLWTSICIPSLSAPSAAGAAEAQPGAQAISTVAIEPGEFIQGDDQGEFHERPAHRVRITRPYHIATSSVTNAQYERFDPTHVDLRGRDEVSRGDDEAVVHVSWEQAGAFCRWLSDQEGRNYRLPTEAEWEYAARAGTTTPYHTGASLDASFHRNQGEHSNPVAVDLTVGQTPANAWGLRDVHGLVEEWCADWYGPYPRGAVVDPVGPVAGDFRVSRGGSHSTPLAFLRSAARMGTLPEDSHAMIGFRVVQAEPVTTQPSRVVSPTPAWASGVDPSPRDWTKPRVDDTPRFAVPTSSVNIPAGSDGPLYSHHNHCPAITVCPNGDLFAIWYTTRREPGRELAVAASRLRFGETEWSPAAPFWDAPGRNDHGDALWWDGRQTLYHFNGLGAVGTWANLALVMRTSTDNGVTWSPAKLINTEHGLRNMPIANVVRTRTGKMVLCCDAVTGGDGGTAVHVSVDGGRTWNDPGRGRPAPVFAEGETGAWIAGIHAGLVELNDGRWLALGRGDAINGQMPKSVSADEGETWRYSASGLPAIAGGQRLTLLRLNEGPLLLVSFTNPRPKPDAASTGGMEFTGADGKRFTSYGMFAALSYDEGQTWPARRLVSMGGEPRTLDGGAWTGRFEMDASHAEPAGYLDAKQSPDGLIHLVSSKLSYRFNLAWLQQPTDAPAGQSHRAEPHPPTLGAET